MKSFVNFSKGQFEYNQNLSKEKIVLFTLHSLIINEYITNKEFHKMCLRLKRLKENEKLFVFTCFAFADFIGMPAPSSVDSSLRPRRNGPVRLVVVAVLQ